MIYNCVEDSVSKTKVTPHFIFLYFQVYYFERERVRAFGGEAERRMNRESQAGFGTVSAVSDVGLELMNHDIMTWTKVRHLAN